MDLFTLLRTCARRWIVVVPVLILTGAVAWWVSASAVPTYKASASVLVVGPSIDGSNPFGQLNSAITSTAIAIQRTVTGPTIRNELSDLGLISDFEVVASGGGDEPILDITAEGDDPDQALDTVSGVIDSIETELATRQKELDVAPENLITVQVLSADEDATKEEGPVMRSMVLVLALGIALAAAAAVTVDRVLPPKDDKGDKNGKRGRRKQEGSPDDLLPPFSDAASRHQDISPPRSDDADEHDDTEPEETASAGSTSDQWSKAEDEVRWPA